MTEYSDEMKRLTEIIIKPDFTYYELKEAVDELYKLFLKITDFNEDQKDNRDNIFLSKGKAIGPVWAAMCIKELMRTRKFLRGIYQGIKAALEKFKDRPIHIVYAGTGPFATLAVPFTSFFSSREIKFTLLEINKNSLNSLEKVIEQLKIRDYIEEIIQCDAAQFKFDKSKSFHMIITETMLNALNREPQAAITLNLVPQMREDGILIPQNIMIEAVAMNPARNQERMLGVSSAEEDYCVHLGEIFNLNSETVKFTECNSTGAKSNYDFPACEIEIPPEIKSAFKQLCLFTSINVYGEELLTSWECSLTLPKLLTKFDTTGKLVSKVNFKYVIDEDPHFEYCVK